MKVQIWLILLVGLVADTASKRANRKHQGKVKGLGNGRSIQGRSSGVDDSSSKITQIHERRVIETTNINVKDGDQFNDAEFSNNLQNELEATDFISNMNDVGFDENSFDDSTFQEDINNFPVEVASPDFDNFKNEISPPNFGNSFSKNVKPKTKKTKLTKIKPIKHRKPNKNIRKSAKQDARRHRSKPQKRKIGRNPRQKSNKKSSNKRKHRKVNRNKTPRKIKLDVTTSTTTSMATPTDVTTADSFIQPVTERHQFDNSPVKSSAKLKIPVKPPATMKVSAKLPTAGKLPIKSSAAEKPPIESSAAKKSPVELPVAAEPPDGQLTSFAGGYLDRYIATNPGLLKYIT